MEAGLAAQRVVHRMHAQPDQLRAALADPQLEGVVFGRFDLSFDARRVVFAWKAAAQQGYRIYEIDLDGSGLRQLTFPQDDEEELVQPVAPQVSAATPQIDFAQAAAHAPGAQATQQHAPTIRAKGLDRPSRPQNLSYSAPSEDGEVEVHAARWCQISR